MTGIKAGVEAVKLVQTAAKVEKAVVSTEKAAVQVEKAVAKTELRRPYIRNETRSAVEAAAPKSGGKFVDPNTGKVIEGKYDLGHKTGNEFRTEKAKAEKEGLTQKEFNDKMNDPKLYQIEDPSSNRSHLFEAKD